MTLVYKKTGKKEMELEGFFFSEMEPGLHKVVCKDIILTKNHLQELHQTQIGRAGNKKVAMLVDLRSVKMFTLEGGNYAKQNAPTYIMGAAMVAQTYIARMVIDFFINVLKPEFQLRVFSDFETASNWLIQLRHNQDE